MSTVPPPACTAEALAMLRAALGYLAAADPAAMTAGEQAGCLRVLEQSGAVAAAARTSVLGAFSAGRGYTADADYSPAAWLMHHTGVTRGAAAGHVAWVRRAAAHPEIARALAAGELPESLARILCAWTDRLPEQCRDRADEILVTAAVSGLGLADLAALAGEILARARPYRPGGGGDAGDGAGEEAGDGTDEAFEDRAVRLATTFGGAGVLHGDLTPECAALVGAVLEALSAPAGPEDDRTRAQRCHDGLAEAMRRLAASGLLPDRAGNPVKAWVHVSLADLMMLDGDSALQEQWTARVRAAWAAHRAAASEGRGDGGAWLDGDAAGAIACDAAMAPFVTGDVNPGALEDLVRLCVQLDKLRCHDGAGTAPDGQDTPAGPGQDPPGPGAALSREALENAIIGTAAGLMSGPGGLASFLRRRQLGARLAGPSLPLDIGHARTIPAGIRSAVILRDQHCRWPGCRQPAAACEVHHVKHKASGGTTSTRDCVLLCSYHHQVIIHRQGWTLILNPDGTTTAWNPGRTKTLHSHGPPARAG